VLFRIGDFVQSLEDIPTWFSDYFDISLEAGQIILSLIVILMFLLPVLLATKGRGFLIPALTFFLTEALLVGIGWLSPWIMVATLCIVALFFSRESSGLVTGG